MGDRITYVGLDVHKEGIVVAVAEGGLRGEVRDYGRIANIPAALDRVMRKLAGDGVRLRFCYEAGPCGYGIQRQLSTAGYECVVVAPSLIPKRAGDRVKTDRRDAANLHQERGWSRQLLGPAAQRSELSSGAAENSDPPIWGPVRKAERLAAAAIPAS